MKCSHVGFILSNLRISLHIWVVGIVRVAGWQKRNYRFNPFEYLIRKLDESFEGLHQGEKNLLFPPISRGVNIERMGV